MPPLSGAVGVDGDGGDPAPALLQALSPAPSLRARSSPRGLRAMWSTQAMRSRFTHRVAIGRHSRSTMLGATSSAIPAGQCKFVPATRRLRQLLLLALHQALLLALRQVRRLARPAPDRATRSHHQARPVVQAVRPVMIRRPTARNAIDHMIQTPGLFWATMANAIPVPKPISRRGTGTRTKSPRQTDVFVSQAQSMRA
jgi:hypothetical protein